MKTEIEILKSPYVLIDVFNFVKSQKIKADKSFESIRFENWQNNNLDFNLKKDTSILKIAYRDSNKDLIKQVLERISKKYQEYSGAKKKRIKELGDQFFKSQIELYSKKSLDSLKKAQEFAFEQNFTMPIIGSQLKIAKNTKSSLPSGTLDVEQIKVRETNLIKFIDSQLLNIENITNDSDEILYIARNIQSKFKNLMSGSKLLLDIDKVDKEIAYLKSIYKENDTSIKNLQKDRENLLNLLKLQVKGFLKASKSVAQANLKNAERPEGIIIQFKELINDATRTKITLTDLENKYKEFLLVNASNEDPWKLITSPTLLPNNVFAQKKKVILFGIIMGGLSGIAFSIAYEIKRNKIYLDEEINEMFNWPLLYNFPLSNISDWPYYSNLFLSSIEVSNSSTINIVPIGDITQEDLYKKLINQFVKTKKTLKFKEAKDLISIETQNPIICICMKNHTSKNELKLINKDLSFLKNNILGIIAIDVFNSNKNFFKIKNLDF